MSEVTASTTDDETRRPLWPRGAVTPAIPNEGRPFLFSVADFSRQAKSWAFFRRLGLGYVSALYLFGQGALNLRELL